MQYTKVLGKCCSSDCSKKSKGKCQSFSEGSTANMCGYCGCHEGAHEFIGHLPIAAPAPAVAAAAPTPAPTTPAKAGPNLQIRRLVAEERKRIFQSSAASPSAPKNTPKKKAKIVEVAPVAVAKPKVILPDTEENRRRDRAEALLEVADEGVTRTDLDRAQYWKLNGEWWMPPVYDVEPIVDFTKYCFACMTQLARSDRQVCKSPDCLRLMFTECGHFGGIECEDLGDDPGDDYFRCCDCKSYSFKHSLYEDHRDSLPPRNHGPTSSRFSNSF